MVERSNATYGGAEWIEDCFCIVSESRLMGSSKLHRVGKT